MGKNHIVSSFCGKNQGMEQLTRIKELRKEMGLTQTQLAKEVGLNFRSISDYERGRLEPSIQTIRSLCKFFECTSDYLLGITDFY